MKKALYEVTTSFGHSEEGEIRECYVVHDGHEGTVLIYHPMTKEEAKDSLCMSLELCTMKYAKVNGKSREVYVSINDDAYVNLTNYDLRYNKPLAKLLGRKRVKIIQKG